MTRKLISLFVVLAFLLTASPIFAANQSWTGVISDSHCGAMHNTASKQAEACVAKCIKAGNKYVFVNSADNKVYKLVPQAKANGHGGHEVTVTGTLSGDTIHVASITMPKM